MLKLLKPIVFFDLETTGVSIQTDRIVQIAVTKINVDGTREKRELLINPTIPIPKEASEVHGIHDGMVEGMPTFKEISKSLKKFFDGCDLGGFNSDQFDIPLLIQEFQRCGIIFPEEELNVVDVIKLERILNSHKLSETYKRYFGKELDDAHDAMVDTDATVEIFFKQLERLKEKEVELNIPSIDKFCQGENERFDLAGKCYVKDGVVHWSFGKNMNKPVMDDRGYLGWVLNSDFPLQTKKLLNELLISNNK